MKSYFNLLVLIILSISMLFHPEQIRAEVVMVSPSASLYTKPESNTTYIDQRIIRLQNYLQSHNSPLVYYSEDFIKWADYYDIDWRLVPAITGVESTFGKRIPFKSYNAYGWANGDYRFKSWPESIEHVSKTLRLKYINKNADTVDKIAKRYAPPSNSWAWKVKFFMEKIDPTPIEFDF